MTAQVVTNLAVGFIVEHDGAPGQGFGPDLRGRCELVRWVWVVLVVLTLGAALVALAGAVVMPSWPLAAWVLSVTWVKRTYVWLARPALGTAGPARQ